MSLRAMGGWGYESLFAKEIGELYSTWDLKWTAAAITIHLKFTRKALSRENFKMRCNFGKKCRFSWQNQPLSTTTTFRNQLFVYIIFSSSFTVIAGTFASFSTTKINMWSKCVTVSFCFETFFKISIMQMKFVFLCVSSVFIFT